LNDRERLLIVDDERNVRATLSSVLADEGYACDTADSGEAALEAIQRRDYDLVLLDIWLPGIDGLQVLERVRGTGSNAEVVMISGHGSIDAAVRSTKLGAFDFIEKPLSLDRVLLVASNALRKRRLERDNLRLRTEVSERVEIIGESTEIVALRRQVDRAAPSNGRVLIFGENGTGKELVARRIHALSGRSEAPFVEVNCAAIPEELIESELFGHVKGAFTDAKTDRVGCFELADHGTLFLDEIANISLQQQAKLLRVLETGEIQRVGSSKVRRVDARVISATNANLPGAVAAGEFREDLLYRLNTVRIDLPPLRERSEDIPLLANHFLERLASHYSRQIEGFSSAAIDALARHSWPGNVRELEHAVERSVLMARGGRIEAADLALRRREDGSVQMEEMTLDEAERVLIEKALERCGGNVSRAAEALGVSRSAMYRRLQRHDIEG